MVAETLGAKKKKNRERERERERERAGPPSIGEKKGSIQQPRPGRLQPPVRQQLEKLLKKGTLKKTLQAHPDTFQIEDIPNTNEWKFQVLK